MLPVLSNYIQQASQKMSLITLLSLRVNETSPYLWLWCKCLACMNYSLLFIWLIAIPLTFKDFWLWHWHHTWVLVRGAAASLPMQLLANHLGKAQKMAWVVGAPAKNVWTQESGFSLVQSWGVNQWIQDLFFSMSHFCKSNFQINT